MTVSLFNPMRTVKQSTVEGHTGVYGRLYLPFTGYWFASGQQIVFNSGEQIQRTSTRINLGTHKPDTFRKDASSCPVGV